MTHTDDTASLYSRHMGRGHLGVNSTGALIVVDERRRRRLAALILGDVTNPFPCPLVASTDNQLIEAVLLDDLFHPVEALATTEPRQLSYAAPPNASRGTCGRGGAQREPDHP